MATAGQRNLWVVAFIVAAAGGLVVFGVLVQRAVTVESADSAEANQRFRDVLADLPSRAPLVTMDESGRFVRRPSSGASGTRPARLYVLAYRAAEQRVISADVPLWFAKIKGPAAQYALRGTGFDLVTLGLTAGDLEQAGAGVVLDETSASGDRLLAWTR